MIGTGLRAGDLRVIYALQDDVVMVLVVRVAHRGEGTADGGCAPVPAQTMPRGTRDPGFKFRRSDQ